MKINNLLVILFFLSIALFSACNEEENLLEVVPENSDSLAIELESKVDFKDFSVGRNNTKIGVIGQYVYLHLGVSSVLDIEEIKVYVQKSETDETPITEAKSFKRDKETELIEEIPLGYDIAPGKYYLVVSVLDKNQKETKIGSEVELKHFMAYEVEVISDVYALNNKILVVNSASGMFSIDELLSSYPIKTAKVLIKKSDTQEWLAEKDITDDEVVGKTEVKELISGIKIDTSLLEDEETWELKLDPYGPADMYLLLEDEKGNKETLLIAQITVRSSFVEIGKVQMGSSKQEINDMKLFPEGEGFIEIDSIKSANKDYYISKVEISFYKPPINPEVDDTPTTFFHELYNAQIDNEKFVIIKNFLRSFPVGTSTLGEFTPTLVIESKPIKPTDDETPSNMESSFILEKVEVIAKP